MHDYREIYQHITDDSITSRIPMFTNGYNGYWYSNIYTLKTISDTFYLPHFHYNLNSKDHIEGIATVKIENDTLNQTIKLFKYFNDDDITSEQDKEPTHSSIYIEYDFFSVVDRPERSIKLLFYNEEDQIIKLPVIVDYGKVSKKLQTYQFNRKYFELVDKASK